MDGVRACVRNQRTALAALYSTLQSEVAEMKGEPMLFALFELVKASLQDSLPSERCSVCLGQWDDSLSSHSHHSHPLCLHVNFRGTRPFEVALMLSKFYADVRNSHDVITFHTQATLHLQQASSKALAFISFTVRLCPISLSLSRSRIGVVSAIVGLSVPLELATHFTDSTKRVS